MSIYFVESSLDTIQTWKENRKKVQVPWCLPNALFILVHFSNVLGELPTHIYSIWSLFFLSILFFGLEEWMTNQWLRQIERKRDTTFSFFMQNLCIFSNKNCQRPFVFIQKKPTACCCINSVRAVGRSENTGVPVLFGGLNLPPLVEVGLTDLPKSGGAMAPPATPGATPLSLCVWR